MRPVLSAPHARRRFMRRKAARLILHFSFAAAIAVRAEQSIMHYELCIMHCGTPHSSFFIRGSDSAAPKAPLCKGGQLRAPPVADAASSKEWQRSKFRER